MKKFSALFSLCALLFAGCVNQPAPQAPKTQQTTAGITITSQQPMAGGTEQGAARELITQDGLVYFKNDHLAKGYLAMPKDGKNHPALVLIHEWWGLNSNMKDMAQQFAKQGYVALAVDLYDGKSATEAAEAQKLAGAVQADNEGAFKNLQAAANYLKAMPEVDKTRVGSVGWCFGGGWAYQMAKNDMGVKATVMYYGQFSDKDDLSHMKATIIGHFGENDTNIKVDNVKEFQATLKTLNGNNEVYIYPNAGHGFANPSNATYNKEAADLAWQRTIDFLAKNL